MTKLAKSAVIDQRTGWRLLVDGEEFPFHITTDGVTTAILDGIYGITLTILVDGPVSYLPREPRTAKPVDV